MELTENESLSPDLKTAVEEYCAVVRASMMVVNDTTATDDEKLDAGRAHQQAWFKLSHNSDWVMATLEFDDGEKDGH